MNDNYITLTIGKKKNIALIAHDNKKADLIEWCEQNKNILTQHFLCGTGTTARMITDYTGLPVKGYNSGPLGGDQQIGAKIVEGQIDFMIFLWDPLEAQPHDPDVRAAVIISFTALCGTLGAGNIKLSRVNTASVRVDSGIGLRL